MVGPLAVFQCEVRCFYILFTISEDVELLWRLARASRDIAQLCKTSEEEKKVLLYEALEYAKRALEKKGSSFAAHKVSRSATMLSDEGYMGLCLPITSRLEEKECQVLGVLLQTLVTSTTCLQTGTYNHPQPNLSNIINDLGYLIKLIIVPILSLIPYNTGIPSPSIACW